VKELVDDAENQELFYDAGSEKQQRYLDEGFKYGNSKESILRDYATMVLNTCLQSCKGVLSMYLEGKSVSIASTWALQ